MRWREWRWRLGRGAALAAASRLSAAGHHAHAVAAAADGNAEFSVYAAGAGMPARLRPIVAALGTPTVTDHDEAALMRACQGASPIELAPGVWIDPRDRLPPPRGELRLAIPPSPAFGDGSHPSTRLAARLILDLDLAGRRVLDLGCGTGVLGLLARARGARRVAFADLDPHAVRACRAACRRNGHPGALVRRGDLLDGMPPRWRGEVLIGNLYADLVLRLLADRRLLMAAGEHLVLSGIAARKERGVRRALVAGGWRVRRRIAEAWWVGLAAVPAQRAPTAASPAAETITRAKAGKRSQATVALALAKSEPRSTCGKPKTSRRSGRRSAS